MIHRPYTPAFKYHPRQYVIVTFLGMNCRGRVLSCVADDGDNRYRVEYLDEDGQLYLREFYEDEIQAVEQSV